MSIQTKLLIVCFVVMASALVLAVTRVLGAWAHHHTSRHDLIAESKRRRMAYQKALADRDNANAAGSVAIEQPGGVDVVDDASEALAQAA